MVQKLIPYLIFLQVSVGLFHAGIGVETWLHDGIYDSQTLFLLCLSLGTLVAFIRFVKMSDTENSLQEISEHMIFLGMIMWIFYESWGNGWEIFLIVFMSVFLFVFILGSIFQSQLNLSIFAGKWGLPDYFWRFGAFLTLINTITISLILILLHEKLHILWVFFAINWIFLWKINFQEEKQSIMT